jgi:hypothetical protein
MRAGEIAAGITPLLTLAWVASPALRARVRAILADYGVAISGDAAPARCRAMPLCASIGRSTVSAAHDR